MKFTTGMRVAVIALASVLALSGCTGSGGSSSGAKKEQTLRIQVGAPPTSLAIGQFPGGESYLMFAVYDTLIERSVDGKLVPAIAESWAYNADQTVLTLKIRKGMTFTDHTPLDAAAVKASLDTARKGAASSAKLAPIVSVDATDASTVAITLKAPDASFLSLMSGTEGTIGATASLTAESSKLNPVGSGPYILDKAGTTQGSVYKLTRNPDYWNVGSYPFEKLEVRVMPDATAVLNAVKSGQLDFASVDDSTAATFQSSSDFTTGANKPQAVAGLWIADRTGAKVPALGDVRVRKAINMALDRKSIAKSIGGGKPTDQIFSPLGASYIDKETYPFDVGAAKKLMADAGYADGFAITMPSTVLSAPYEPTLSQELGDIGIKVTWETVPFQDFFTKVFGGSYGMFFMYNAYAGSDAVTVDNAMTGVFNPFRLSTPEFDKLLASANSAPEDKQAEAFRKVNQYYLDEAWFAPVGYAAGSYVASKSIAYTPPVVSSTTLRPWAPASK